MRLRYLIYGFLMLMNLIVVGAYLMRPELFGGESFTVVVSQFLFGTMFVIGLAEFFRLMEM